jgi:hypothetical protein
MKKTFMLFALTSVAAFFLTVLTPRAYADTYSYTFADGTTANATGTLTGTGIGNGVFDLTSGTINVSYDGGAVSTGTLTGSCCGGDDKLYTLGDPSNGLLLDVGGLVFTLTDGSLVNMWGGDNNGYGSSYSITQNNLDWVDYPGTFAVSATDVAPTPEPSSLFLLGTGLLGGAGLFYRRRNKGTTVLMTAA